MDILLHCHRRLGRSVITGTQLSRGFIHHLPFKSVIWHVFCSSKFTLQILYFQRWKRRYFVLYAPPASTLLPGTCSAVLDYYDNDKQLYKRGTIDLASCVEVQAQTNVDALYKHVFLLRTKHRGQDRTYYLSADSEDDMKQWLSLLRVLCLEGSGEYCGRRIYNLFWVLLNVSTSTAISFLGLDYFCHMTSC